MAPPVMRPLYETRATPDVLLEIGLRLRTPLTLPWQTFEEMNERENLRERGSYYLLARFVAGEVFHVDSVVNDGKVVFAGANQYGRPPMQVAHQGGAYISRTLERGSADEKTLLAINKKLVPALGLERGATHAEFIKSDADGKFYFLEIAARVGGAYISDVLEAASGVNLWREWARLEIGDGKAPSKITPQRKEYAGIILSLAKQENPDTSTYADEEIIYRVKKRHHAGLIVRAPQLNRVTELLDDYALRFAEDFVAAAKAHPALRVASVGALYVIDGAYLAPYGTITGQIVLLAVFSMFAVALATIDAYGLS